MRPDQIGAVLALVVSGLSTLAYARSHFGAGRADNEGREPQPGSVRSFRHVHTLVQLSIPAAAVAILIGQRSWALAMPVPDAVALTGITITVLGFALFAAAKRALGQHYAPCFDARLPDVIVQSGPYGRIRHPIYTANLAALVGLTLATGSGWIAVSTSLVAVAYTVSARREEEALCAARVDYVAYMERTGRFLPALRGSAEAASH